MLTLACTADPRTYMALVREKEEGEEVRSRNAFEGCYCLSGPHTDGLTTRSPEFGRRRGAVCLASCPISGPRSTIFISFEELHRPAQHPFRSHQHL